MRYIDNIYLETRRFTLSRSNVSILFLSCYICRREQQSGYKQCKKRLVHPLLKAQERLYRRRNPTIQFSTSSTPTTPSSPVDYPLSPAKATTFTQLNEANQPETVLASNNNNFKQWKYRHRRVGSGCGVSCSPRSSPHRERKVDTIL